MDPLAPFTPAVREWFEGAFDAPTPAQERGWPAIASGSHTVIQAPTGSGKTLAAFLWALDQAHAVAGTKRGAHLAVSLERLDRLTESPVQRIGLSATQRPLEEIGRFVSGARPIRLVDAGHAKELDLRVVVPLEDMTVPEEGSYNSIWPSIHPEILKLVESHRSTIVFVNNRRLAERLALRLDELADLEIARAHHGSLAREQRLEVEELLKAGEIPCLVATSSLELGIDMGAVDLVVQVESPKSVTAGLQRIGRAGHGPREVAEGRIFPKFRADLLET